MADTHYDVLVIGAGPGGYACALRAAEAGMRVACIDKRGSPGGACLHVGCIPSKALLHASHMFHEAKHGARFGVVATPTLDLAKMMAFQKQAVSANVKGVEFLFRKRKVVFIAGEARLNAAGAVLVATSEGEQTLTADKVVLAPGARPVAPSVLAPDGDRVVDSTGALAFDAPPKRLVVIGAGYIGLEMGSVWSRLGSEVVVIEALDRIAPGMDGEVARALHKALTRQGMKFRLGTKVEGLTKRARGVDVALAGDTEVEKADKVLVAIGRAPDLDGLNLEEAGVACEGGRIKVDDLGATSRPGVWAIGDATLGPQLAHKAMEEGTTLAERFAGSKGARVNRAAIPAVAYTHPEAASVGATQEDLDAADIPYRVGRFGMAASGRGRTMGERDGMVKLLADPKDDRLLGAHILAPGAGDLIAQLTLAIEFEGCAEDVARVIAAHPTFSEMTKEAAWQAAGMAPLHG